MSTLSTVNSQDCRRLLSRKQQILPRIHCFLRDFTVVMKKQDVTVRIWPFFLQQFFTVQCLVEHVLHVCVCVDVHVQCLVEQVLHVCV